MSELMNEYRSSFADLFRINFGAKPGERVLILSDQEPLAQGKHPFADRRAMVETAVEAATELNLHAELMMFQAAGTHGTEPPVGVWQQIYGAVVDSIPDSDWQDLLHKRASVELQDTIRRKLSTTSTSFPDIILVLSHYSLSHTRFRNWSNELTGARIATMPGALPEQFLGVMKANWFQVAARSDLAADLLSQAQSVRIRSTGADGTEHCIQMGLKDRTGLADTGLLTERSAFGNLPGGEGFIAPVEGTSNGSFAAYTSDGHSLMVFTVSDGNFVSVSQPEDPSVSPMLSLLETAPQVANLAELGIGTNEKARDTGNILEGEKIFGTCHIAFGDNKGFGGTVSAPFHRDYIVPEPDLELLMDDPDMPSDTNEENWITFMSKGTWKRVP